MREAICETLRRHLNADPRVSLFGQDIEDPKGDVFGVTRGLSTEFPGRVSNAPLAEATIVGKSIGRALAGARPVAFLQFADFLPLAYNQILCELGSLYWRTGGNNLPLPLREGGGGDIDVALLPYSSPLAPREGNHHAERDAYYEGIRHAERDDYYARIHHAERDAYYERTSWQAPVIVMIACGGYRPGLGPFHSQTLESIAAHTPGIDVVMPSTAADAAELLDAAFASGRPTLFFYPKACLNQPCSIGVSPASSRSIGVSPVFPRSIGVPPVPSRSIGVSPVPSQSGESPAPQVSLGKARLVRQGDDLTFVSWGSTVEHCCWASDALTGAGRQADVIDLRSLSPWDEHAVLESVSRTRRLVVVHEDNHTCGFGAEVLATVLEKSTVPVKARRVARPDTFVPCHFGNQLEVLPSHRRVLAAACELLEIDLAWQDESPDEAGICTVDAIGSGPADEMVIVTDILVECGARLTIGDPLANVEASKAVVTISSNISGIVQDILVRAGQTVRVGDPLLRIRTTHARRKPITRERIGTPRFTRATPSGGGGMVSENHRAQRERFGQNDQPNRSATPSDVRISHSPRVRVGRQVGADCRHRTFDSRLRCR